MSNRSRDRNKPCSCGSGKKYKFCCINKDSLWSLLRSTDEKVTREIIAYSQSDASFDYNKGWREFSGSNTPFDYATADMQLFGPWLFYHWDRGLPNSRFIGEEGESIAEIYLDSHEESLSRMEQRYIVLCCYSPFSFYEVVSCKPGHGFVLRDLLVGGELFVCESSASENAEPGDIFFTKVVDYDDVRTISGMGRYCLGQIDKSVIIDLRSAMRDDYGIDELNMEHLFDCSAEIRSVYQNLTDRMNRKPQLVNADGDPIIFHNVTFQLTLDESPFGIITDLAEALSGNDVFDDMEFGEDKELQKAEFLWINDSNSVLAQVEYHNMEISAQVNSAERALNFRKKLEEFFGDKVKHLSTKIQTMGEVQADLEDNPMHQDPLEMTPELDDILNQMMRDHWKKWLDDDIPALGGVSPRISIKSKEGREKVKALLDHIERQERGGEQQGNQLKYILEAREKLGL